MNYDVKKTAIIVKALRKGKVNLSQEKVADAMGINIKTYQSIEQGSRGASIDTLCIIATYYNVSLNYLITGVSEVSKEIATLFADMTYEKQIAILNMIKLMN